MPSGTLFVVATPIGNLSDVSRRAAETLASVDIVACEDTRTSRTLLAHLGVSTKLMALHQHNERGQAETLIDRLRSGIRIALISDAGTPAVSDPGALLVELAHREHIPVIPIPGPSAAIAAFSAAGFPGGRFLFAGFLPSTASARQAEIRTLSGPWPVVLYEAPHRIAKTLEDLQQCLAPQREIVIAREITKKFEEIARMPLADARMWLDAGPHRQQGEFVLVLGPGEPDIAADEKRGFEVLELLLEAVSPAEAARIASRITGVARNRLYREALERSGRKMRE